MPAFSRAFLLRSSMNVELSYYIKKQPALHRHGLCNRTRTILSLFQLSDDLRQQFIHLIIVKLAGTGILMTAAAIF